MILRIGGNGIERARMSSGDKCLAEISEGRIQLDVNAGFMPKEILDFLIRELGPKFGTMAADEVFRTWVLKVLSESIEI